MLCLRGLGGRLGSPLLNFDGRPRGPPIKIWGGRALICALWFASLICVICLKMTVPHKNWGRILLLCLGCSVAHVLLLRVLAVCLVSWLVGCLFVGWFICWLVGWLAGFGWTCFACVHACSICLIFRFIACSDSLTSLWRFAWSGAHVNRLLCLVRLRFSRLIADAFGNDVA